MGRTAISARELRRAGILARVAAKTLTLTLAAKLMEVSYRQAKRLYGRYRREGAKGLHHRSAGRPSNRTTARRLRTRVLALVRAKYSGDVATRFGPTLAAERSVCVIAFNMRRRIREFGVRIALGASTRQVLSGVLAEGLALTAIGLGAGFLLGLAVALAVRGALFGVTRTDTPTYAAAFLLLGAVALAACCLPALSAARIDPVQALRTD